MLPPRRLARSSHAYHVLARLGTKLPAVGTLTHRRLRRSTMVSIRVDWDRLNDDVVELILERVGPPGMFEPCGIQHPRYRGQLVAAQRDLLRFRCLSRRLGQIANAVAAQHLGAFMRARAMLTAQ